MRFEDLQTRARKIGVDLNVVPVVAEEATFQVYRFTNGQEGYILEVPDLVEVHATLASLEMEQGNAGEVDRLRHLVSR